MGGGAVAKTSACPQCWAGPWGRTLTTPSRKAVQRVSSGLVAQNSRNNRRPMG